jgi:hypothetical protein
MIAARRPPAPEPVKKFVRPSAIGRLARSAALLLILRQSASRGAAGVSSPRFSWRGFLLAPQIRAKPGMPAWARRRRPHRGLVHACRIVIQNRREPARDLRDARAAGVTSLPVYGGWVRRSRRAMLRWHPDKRESQERCDSHTNESHEYPTFSFHFPPPLLNRRPTDDPISRRRLPLRTSIGKSEPSP